MPWTVPPKPTLTELPASPAVATLLYSAEVVAVVPDGDRPTSVHPAGAVGRFAEATDASRSMSSPAATPDGTVSVSVDAFAFVCADATNEIGVPPGWVGATECVTVA